MTLSADQNFDTNIEAQGTNDSKELGHPYLGDATCLTCSASCHASPVRQLLTFWLLVCYMKSQEISWLHNLTYRRKIPFLYVFCRLYLGKCAHKLHHIIPPFFTNGYNSDVLLWLIFFSDILNYFHLF